MKSLATMLIALFVLFIFGPSNLLAINSFERVQEIPVPEADLNNGGVGNIIAGVDLDGDGKKEIYVVNDNWNDGPTEVIPRIYKLEYDGSEWQVVWKAVAPVEYQNTWPALAVADLDKDGKSEIVWGPVNSFSVEKNPYRIVVYEVKGDGSDVLGVEATDSDTLSNGEKLLYKPNAAWTITDQDEVNIRPTKFVITDVDNDGVDEIIFSDRKGNNGGYYFGVVSVSDIPDNGDGSETWTLEASGLDFGLKDLPVENKWDVAVIGNNIYLFCEVEITKIYWDGSDWNYDSLSPLLGGASFITAQVVDLDNDGQKEIVAGEYSWGADTTRIVLLKESGDTLKHFELAHIGSSERLIGGDCGDIDGDGYLDFVFGTRYGNPNGAIYRLRYKGGDIEDPANYELTQIDTNYAEGGIWSVIDICNIDDDPQLEVLYTSSIPAGGLFGGTQPIVVLDYVGTGITEEEGKLSHTFKLFQNYPNPFNSRTVISFSLSAREKVELNIYDLLGNKVITLFSGYLNPGEYRFNWDARDANSREISTGTYIYQLRTANNVETKRMLYIK
ncbi:MAG: T9SS type A sorting domain-containing protein [Candidatus Marinimicrobia bacterium]|nr:T9SS type A sorting domain-containing protein [Candidatus Neomarinimicrobiota bacterium]